MLYCDPVTHETTIEASAQQMSIVAITDIDATYRAGEITALPISGDLTTTTPQNQKV